MKLFKYISNISQTEKKYNMLKKMKEEDYPEFLKKEYFRRTGDKLNLDKPKKYTEKMQYAKLYLNSQLKTELSDKYLVRDWVEKKIGAQYLIPLLGVWDKYDKIDFELLPSQFVLKANHSSGMNLVVKDKSEINHLKEKLKFDYWMKKDFAYYLDLQPHYKNIERKILAEKFISDKNGHLRDYRFLCFDGKPIFVWLDIDDSTGRFFNIYDLDWNIQPWTFSPFGNSPEEISKPEKFSEMLEIATKLSQGFSHVRVDLYNVDGKIYFGEMTFTSTGGYRLILPEEYNYKVGDLWELPEKREYMG